MPKITMKDIAKKAGVSQPLVSLIMNNNTKLKVSEKSRDKVLRIAREFNYVPDHGAQALKTGRKNIIGITSSPGVPIKQVFNSSYFSEVYTGLGEVMAQNGYRLLFQQNKEVMPVDEALSLAQANMVDGLIFIMLSDFLETFESEQLPALKKLNIPFVVIHSMTDDFGCSAVGVDNMRIGFEAVSHLLGHGYEKVAFASADSSEPMNGLMLKGYEKALSAAGRPYDDTLIFTCNGMYADAGADLATRLLGSGREIPRAFFFANSFLAHGFIHRIRAAGLRIPGDVAVIATGNMVDPRIMPNELSLYRHPAREKGHAAAEVLLKMLDKPVKRFRTKPYVVEAPLVKGGTCGCIKQE